MTHCTVIDVRWMHIRKINSAVPVTWEVADPTQEVSIYKNGHSKHTCSECDMHACAHVNTVILTTPSTIKLLLRLNCLVAAHVTFVWEIVAQVIAFIYAMYLNKIICLYFQHNDNNRSIYTQVPIHVQCLQSIKHT